MVALLAMSCGARTKLVSNGCLLFEPYEPTFGVYKYLPKGDQKFLEGQYKRHVCWCDRDADLEGDGINKIRADCVKIRGDS